MAFRVAAAAVAAIALANQASAWVVELPPCLDDFKPYVSMGCYQDNTGGTPLLDWRTPLDQHSMTIEKCVSQCKGNGYRYAGLSYFGVCHCGTTVNGPKVAENNCALPCSGNSAQICGGYDYLSVYQDPTFTPIEDVTVEDYAPLGCWTDRAPERTLIHLQENMDKTTMTTEKCLVACKNGGYPFAGTEFGGECWCGVVLGNYTAEAPAADCTSACSGAPGEICGGPDRLSLYVAKELQSLEPCGYTEPKPSTTPTPSTTTTPTQTQSLCTATITKPSTCEYGCGKWCNKDLPDWDDDDGCAAGGSSCKMQVAACFKNAGWPGVMSCWEYADWCKDIDSYCSSTCKKGKKGSCKKNDCFKKKPPKGGKPPVTTTTLVPCTTKSTSTTTSTTSTTSCQPSPTNICKQPTDTRNGYGPGNPVGGIELPVLTCNDLKSDFLQHPFKLYTDSDSKKCGGWSRPRVPDACAAACKEQYKDCLDVYAQGCRQYGRGKARRDVSTSYFEWNAQTPAIAKRFFFGDSYSSASNKCKIQYEDCLAENKGVNPGKKCDKFGSGW